MYSSSSAQTVTSTKRRNPTLNAHGPRQDTNHATRINTQHVEKNRLCAGKGRGKSKRKYNVRIYFVGKKVKVKSKKLKKSVNVDLCDDTFFSSSRDDSNQRTSHEHDQSECVHTSAVKSTVQHVNTAPCLSQWHRQGLHRAQSPGTSPLQPATARTHVPSRAMCRVASISTVILFCTHLTANTVQPHV